MKLYAYFRSSATYRVNIALHFKNIEHEYCPVNLLAGEHLNDDYKRKNAQTYVPALELKQGIISQSLAIIEYLDEMYPKPTLLPGNAWDRANIRRMAYQIACDIHPLNNVSVLKYLASNFDADEQQRNEWYAHWIQKTFSAIEAQVQSQAGVYCYGDSVTLSDLCLVPQVYNARRYQVDLNSFPKLLEIDRRLNELPEFKASLPEKQLDSTI